MASKKASGSSKTGEEKRKVVCKTIEFKKELIAKKDTKCLLYSIFFYHFS